MSISLIFVAKIFIQFLIQIFESIYFLIAINSLKTL